MNNREYLTIRGTQDLILQRFTGQSRVSTREIVNHVEKAHYRSVRELSENEKQIVDDVLRCLWNRGLAAKLVSGLLVYPNHNRSSRNGIMVVGRQEV